MKAAFNPQPGVKDDVADEVSFWSDAELRELFVDEAVLAQLMLDPSRTNPKIPIIGRRPPPAHTSWQLSRMRVLACAASGKLKSNTCVRLRADEEIDPTLKRLAKAVESSEDGLVLRRGALLHSDIAMFGPPVVLAPDTAQVGDGGPVRIQMADGESTGFNPAPIHWQMYLVSCTPRGVTKEGWDKLDVRVKRAGAVKARPGYQS